MTERTVCQAGVDITSLGSEANSQKGA